MFGIFSTAKIAVVVVALTVAGGGYWYVQKLQTQVKTLEANQVILSGAMESKDSEIARLNADIKEVKEINNRISTESKVLNGQVDELRRKLSEHDLGFLAENKPGLVEKIINNDIQNTLKSDLEDIMETEK